MLPYPQIDPVIFQLGPLAVRWYGLMYVLAFIAAYFLVRYQIRRYPHPGLAEHFDNLNLVLIISLIVGSRLGYVVFYNFSYYLQHPLEIFATWQGGMSFHGGMLGLLIGGWLFCRRTGLDFFRTADAYAVAVPIGLGLGRLGNFINGELYGRVTEMPWGMVFPNGGPLPRHPSQLYESFLEGLVLFIIMWYALRLYWQRKWPAGRLVAIFLGGYGIFRFMVEFFREPDAHLGLTWGLFSRGQLLSGLMIIAALLLFYRRPVAR
ncbi:prolipoprotein diacylglyceryl transferase [Desulfurivibrio dismutans]|uniref:prolipoprotein diacylglyceryl transferase n=1 Tax=Desulfurivibrio dismutans TaxID=1398908 RepID=UPI0023DBB67D|nr:prolipoprotein diacylglyceryl transferase [Desulfurivibrio alkaliphilus]MDF1613979.1 prolipoprotein diacylglyceryl transferase [Desulfurivibrio alkaliphilus]